MGLSLASVVRAKGIEPLPAARKVAGKVCLMGSLVVRQPLMQAGCCLQPLLGEIKIPKVYCSNNLKEIGFMLRTWLVLAILAVVGVGAVAGCSGPDAPKQGGSTET